jgi:hypothetical protein
MREKGWSRPFEDPIDLPRGRQFITLDDGNYIPPKFPKAEHTAPEWQDAMQALILVATIDGPAMRALGPARGSQAWATVSNLLDCSAKEPERWTCLDQSAGLQLSLPLTWSATVA